MSQGSLDTKNFNNAADIFVYARTNEVFVADGYAQPPRHRAATPTPERSSGCGAPTATCRTTPRRIGWRTRGRARSSSTWCTACGCRTTAWSTWRTAATTGCRCSPWTASSSARSSWSERRSCSARRSPSRSRPIPRSGTCFWRTPATARSACSTARTLEEVGSIGRIGRYAGQFIFLHNVAVDSAGNLYTAEVGGGRRVQKFMLTRP